MKDAAEGEPKAFQCLVRAYKKRLHAYLFIRIGDSHRAEDLVQESFLRAFRAVRDGKYDQEQAPGPWLMAIARNCSTDYLRACRRKPLTFEDSLHPESSPDSDPHTRAIASEKRVRLARMLLNLPEEQRVVVEMKVLGGLKFQEVASTLNIPISTAKSRLK